MLTGVYSSRIRQRHAAEHVAVLRHLALAMLQRHPTPRKLSIKTRRFKAATDEHYLFKILSQF